MRRSIVCAVLSLGVAHAQAKFDVASIRPSNPKELDAGWAGISVDRGRFNALNSTLRDIIADAYGVAEDRILGGPEWIYTDRFQITAKAEQPVDKKTADTMLRSLLADRFMLRLHRESRVRQMLVIEIAKRGPKLQHVTDGPQSFDKGRNRIDAKTVTMAQFAEILTHELRQPVVDRTGLKGAFKFTLHWNEDETDEVSAATKEQLGLTLKSKRLPAEMLVIDRAEHPTAN
jgi:uncharacterized protein (TIGR03435 family)